MKTKTLDDFILETANIFSSDAKRIMRKGYVCDGCRKHFNLDELFRDDEAVKWLCDDCLKKKEGENESRKNR